MAVDGGDWGTGSPRNRVARRRVHRKQLFRACKRLSMSATPGKVCVDGVADVAGQQVFVLHLIQARRPELVACPFFAAFIRALRILSELPPEDMSG